MQPPSPKVSLWLPGGEDGWEGGGGAMSPILEEEEARGRWVLQISLHLHDLRRRGLKREKRVEVGEVKVEAVGEGEEVEAAPPSPSLSLPSSASSKARLCVCDKQDNKDEIKDNVNENSKNFEEEGYKSSSATEEKCMKDTEQKQDQDKEDDVNAGLYLGLDFKEHLEKIEANEHEHDVLDNVNKTEIGEQIDEQKVIVVEVGKQKEIIEKQKSEVEQQTDDSVKLEVPKKEENELKLELKDVGSGVDEEEKLSARARKIYLMKELFGDDSVVDEVRSSRSSTLLLL